MAKLFVDIISCDNWFGKPYTGDVGEENKKNEKDNNHNHLACILKFN